MMQTPLTNARPEAGAAAVSLDPATPVPTKPTFRAKYLKRVAHSKTLQRLLGQGNPPTDVPAKPSFRTKYLKRVKQPNTPQKLLDQGASAIGPLRVIADIVDCIVNPEELLSGKQEYEGLREELEKILETLTQYDDGTASPTITAAVERLCKDIKQELRNVEGKISQQGLGRIRKESGDLNEVLRSYKRIQDYLRRISLNLDMTTWLSVDISATNNLLDRLQPAQSAYYNSAQAIELQRGPCTEGTRINVLDHIAGWVGASDPESVYWMSGMAGTGKTTISYSLCEQLDTSGRLAASFFCSRLLSECRDVNKIIPSIAYQLARFSHPFRYALAGVLKEKPDAHTLELDTQFHDLISQPLSRVATMSPNRPEVTDTSLKVADTLPESLVVVIDALDECVHKKSTSRILGLLLMQAANLPIKFIVSSRPESEIRGQMKKQGNQPGSRIVLHELDRHIVQADIDIYLRSALVHIQPSEEQIATLIARAGLLFIHAATLVRYITLDNFCGNWRTRLANVLDVSTTAGKQHKDIDELYTAILQASLDNPDLEDEEKDDVRQVLHTIICVEEPLTVDALSGLLRMNDVGRVHAALRSLWSVLHISGANELVTTLHASFPEYMLNPSRSKQYHCDPQVHNQILTLRCFDCFRDVRPQFNICELESSYVPDRQIVGLENRVERVITTELYYAARFWATHLQSTIGSNGLIQELEEFLSVRLLLWMEVMNLKGRKDAMIEAIRRTESCDMNYPDDLRALIWDAFWFTTTFAEGSVSESTPHIYTSMLPFWPNSNPISRLYARKVQSTVATSGTAITQRQQTRSRTWYYSGGTPFSPAYSPDSTQVALGVGTGIILLNASTGHRVALPLTGHSDAVRSVQFSPDGTKIVSGSFDDTIRVWSTQSGESVLGPLKGHNSWVLSVTFSPDSSQIASGSEDGAICIWDACSGVLLFNWPGAHSKLIRAKYLPDGRHIVSIGTNPRIVVWDVETGQALKSFGHNGLEGHISAGDISPDGRHVAFGSLQNSIYVWHTRTGQIALGPLTIQRPGRVSSITSICFSPDGSWIVSGSTAGNLCIWNVQTGDLVFESLDGHTSDITSVTFSPDTTCILSSSFGKTLCLWNARGMLMTPKLVRAQTGPVLTISASPDSTRMVSGSEDGTIRVWDVESGDMVAQVSKKVFTRAKWPTCEGEREEILPDIRGAIFSSDSTRLLVNTSHGPFAFDAKTGALHNIFLEHIHLRGFFSLFEVLGFVFDVSLIVLFVGPPLEFMPSHDSGFISVCLKHIYIYLVKLFALAVDALRMDLGLQIPASTLPALMFQALIIRLIGTTILGDIIFGPVDVHSPRISCANFSSNGARIVSGTSDGIIRIHDAYTNRLVLVISTPTTGQSSVHLSSVAFSSDGYLVFSKSDERRPQMHCARSGKLLIDLNDSEWDGAIGFSPDGTHVLMENLGFISLTSRLTRESIQLVVTRGTSGGAHVKWLDRHLFAFIADGSRIAAILQDNSIGIWDVQTGKPLYETIKLNVPKVKSMAYLPDGGYIITGSCDGTICVTNIQHKLEKHPYRPMDDLSTDLSWKMSEDGWVVDNQSRLLVWVPPELRASLAWPRMKHLISRKGWLQLDFKGAYLGESWAKCYRSQ